MEKTLNNNKESIFYKCNGLKATSKVETNENTYLQKLLNNFKSDNRSGTKSYWMEVTK